jgi:four helix bundle protein
MLLAKNVYQATAGFPNEERFGLTNQMRRAAVSVPSNIAEGHARSSTAQFQYFISIAMGSIAELETQILLSGELGFCDDQAKDKLLEQLDEIGRMLRGFDKSLSSRAKD